jgi:putative transposase
MKRIDAVPLEWPFLGSRRISDALADQGLVVNRQRVQRLMRIMGLTALYPKPRTTRPAPGHRIYPYLLRDLTIDRPNQVWCTDITYLPMARGFLYLVAVMDWYSRKVLSRRVSNTMDDNVCVDAREAAIADYGTPEISIPIKAASLLARRSQTCLSARQSRSAWMDAGAGWTTCSSSVCGEA